MENFHYYAMHYLDDWYSWECKQIKDIRSKNKQISCDALWYMSVDYKIIRNFKKINEEIRLSTARQLLHKAPKPTKATVNSVVEDFSNDLCKAYSKNSLISASSKMLWMMYKSPVIIYDLQALAKLKTVDPKLKANDYPYYREVWLREYVKREELISEACSNLSEIRKYTSVPLKISNDAIDKLASHPWFRERVFDKFLWDSKIKLK